MGGEHDAQQNAPKDLLLLLAFAQYAYTFRLTPPLFFRGNLIGANLSRHFPVAYLPPPPPRLEIYILARDHIYLSRGCRCFLLGSLLHGTASTACTSVYGVLGTCESEVNFANSLLLYTSYELLPFAREMPR